MDALKVNTPEELHQAIGEFLQSDYSRENLVKMYDDTRKCAASFRGIYSALPILSARKSDPLDGLQDIMDWSNEASKVVDDIVSNLEQQTISKVTSQLQILRGIADSVLSLVDIKLKEQAQKEARAKVEKDYKKLNEEATKTKGMPFIQKVEVVRNLEMEALYISRREKKDALQIYLSKDTTFKNRISQKENEINRLFESLNKLVGSDTPTGKLLDIYCKLKNIPLQRQFDDVGYAYSPINDWADVICDGCNRLYTSIDNAIKTFEEIQAKVAQKITESRQQQKKDHNGKIGDTCKARDSIQKTVTAPNKTMDNLEQQIEACLNELSDDELNKLAIHLKVPRAHEGIQAPLGVKISDLQRINFIKWVKKTGNIEKTGIYLGIIPNIEKQEVPTKKKEQKSLQEIIEVLKNWQKSKKTNEEFEAAKSALPSVAKTYDILCRHRVQCGAKTTDIIRWLGSAANDNSGYHRALFADFVSPEVIADLEKWQEQSEETSQGNKNNKREEEGMITPKPPEFLQKLLWIIKYSGKHWKIIALAVIILGVLFFLKVKLENIKPDVNQIESPKTETTKKE